MQILDTQKIEKSIIKGANYLFLLQNVDGGIKYEDEKSLKSGIWVTAEALEFFLSSKIIPMTAYEKVARMIDYIVKTQDKSGAWSVIPNDNGFSDEKELSAIATGHCIYVLKMALVGGYNDNLKKVKDLKNAISKGENWLRLNKKESDGLNYWGSNVSNPNGDIGQRMECILTSYYSVLGLLNPRDSTEDDNNDQIIVAKTISFFNAQVDFFIKTYTSEIKNLSFGDFAKISSTICRLASGLANLGADISEERKKGLRKLLDACSKNTPFMTSAIKVSGDVAKQFTATYNNNTPFDMANALIVFETNVITIGEIITEYLNHQNSEGFWYLNFSDAYVVKAWTTAEALIVLEKALIKYNLVELDQERRQFENEKEQMNKKINSLDEEVVSLRKRALIAIIISIALSIIGIIAIALWSGMTPDENKNKVLSYILDVLIVPLAVNIISSVIMALRNSGVIKKKNK